jgi:RNA polymerase sigma-70 factor, ECF subfamily
MLSAAPGEALSLTTGRKRDNDNDIIDLVEIDNTAEAITRLMNRYGVAVYRYCRLSLHDAALAADVHQQIFIEAFRDLPRYGKRGSLRSWLFGIANHRILDAARKRNQERSRIMRGAVADIADPRASSRELIDDARLHAALAAAVSELPDKTRSAVLLHFQQGFTFEEMSVICNEKPGTLSARVVRALRVLRASIEARLGARS